MNSSSISQGVLVSFSEYTWVLDTGQPMCVTHLRETFPRFQILRRVVDGNLKYLGRLTLLTQNSLLARRGGAARPRRLSANSGAASSCKMHICTCMLSLPCSLQSDRRAGEYLELLFKRVFLGSLQQFASSLSRPSSAKLFLWP